MKVVTAAQMRDLEQKMISELAVPSEDLMERAGAGVADAVMDLAHASGHSWPSVLLVAGRGNNGGDAFVAARCLAEQDVDAEVWLVGNARDVKGDALEHLNRMKDAGVPLYEMPAIEDWDPGFINPRDADIVVDGILGTGTVGPARGPAAAAIHHVNTMSEFSLVVSIDLPSGLDADTGRADGGAVMADLTVTLGLPKRGLIQPGALDYVGSVEVVDLGIPEALVNRLEATEELLAAQDLRGLIKRRPRAAHKGLFGHVLILGGAAGYAGAVGLAARAAVRSGAGLVTALVPAGIASTVSALVPEAMIHPAPETPTGSLAANSLKAWTRNLADFDAVLAGPGMTSHDDSRSLVEILLSSLRKPLLLDADALNVCRGKTGLLSGASGPVLLTPHPGEMARLMDCAAADIQKDRVAVAVEAARRFKATVILKGAGTVIAGTDHSPHINLTGNPGMATGGMGDVLAGLTAGLLAQGLSPFDAARVGVYLHGRAGDIAAGSSSQAGLTADDVIEALPDAFHDLSAR